MTEAQNNKRLKMHNKASILVATVGFLMLTACQSDSEPKSDSQSVN